MNKKNANEILSTSTPCPVCGNKDVYLIQLRENIWKVCKKCKIIFYCADSYGSFTDMAFMNHLAKGRSIKNYEKETKSYFNKKYDGYEHRDHP